jgi:PREDICTED: similar to predicted protein, partial
MNTRRLIATAGSALLATSLLACSSDTTTSTPSGATTASETTASETTTSETTGPGATTTSAPPTTPAAPPTAAYDAPADNQVAQLLTVTHIPAGCSYAPNTKSDRLSFATVTDREAFDSVESVTGYTIRLESTITTAAEAIAQEAARYELSTDVFTTTGEATIDGETAQTYAGASALPDGSGYIAERGAVVTHNGQTFLVAALAMGKTAQPTLSEDEFKDFLKGIVWAA